MSSISPNEYNDLLAYFSEGSAARHIISLALTEVNNTLSTSTAVKIGDVAGVGDLVDLTAFNSNDTYIDNQTISTAIEGNGNSRPRLSADIPFWLIPCYSIILLFAIVGNVLVITTLVQNRRMRTITNLFLLNLAISDILLGVFCMPVTLVGTLLRHFIFGEFLCKFIPFAQAASVAVSSWTLVAISCERYYAICHPLKSRTWQTLSHAYKIIGFIWFGSIVCMTPIAIFSQLIPTSRQGLRKCREHWPDDSVGFERSYNIFLDLILLVLPLIILCVAYILITRTLYVSMKHERAMIFDGSGSTPRKLNSSNNSNVSDTGTGTGIVMSGRSSVTGFNLNAAFRCQSRNKDIAGGKRGGKRSTTVTATTTANVAASAAATVTVTANDNGNGNAAAANGQNELTEAGDNNDGKIADGADERSPAQQQQQRKQRKKQPSQQQQQQQQQQKLSHAETGLHVASGGKRMMLAPLDGHQLTYCVRSASMKSLNRNNNDDRIRSVSGGAGAGSAGGINTARDCGIHVSPTASMTVINLPQSQQHSANQHQRFKCFQQRQYLEAGRQDVQRERRKSNSTPSLRITEAALRRSNVSKNLESKKRVVKMLFVLVLEFFVCWTPLYVINTVSMFIGPAIYEYIDYTSISFFQLLAYSSSCCNPITYCFMNAGFRRAFLDTFKGLPPFSAGGRFCRKRHKNDMNLSMAGNSIMLANSATHNINATIDSPRL